MARALARARIPQGGYTVRTIIRMLPPENSFEELVRSTLYPVTSTNLIARALSAVMEATREHYAAQDCCGMDDCMCGDNRKRFCPNCPADIARRATLILRVRDVGK